MRYAYEYDEEGFFTCQVPYITVNDQYGTVIDILPKNACDVHPKDGLFRAKWNADLNDWVEGATEEYIEAIKNPPPSEENVNLISSNAFQLKELSDAQAQLEDAKEKLAAATEKLTETQQQLEQEIFINADLFKVLAEKGVI